MHKSRRVNKTQSRQKEVPAQEFSSISRAAYSGWLDLAPVSVGEDHFSITIKYADIFVVMLGGAGSPEKYDRAHVQPPFENCMRIIRGLRRIFISKAWSSVWSTSFVSSVDPLRYALHDMRTPQYLDTCQKGEFTWITVHSVFSHSCGRSPVSIEQEAHHINRQ